ncbi:hypothetical protein [Paenibacillus sp. P32E]|uniref:hypothetical protein n=1 Tax=Paenibacillus sp. P32E TaxID=1349434 RepID=UPI00093BC4CE|nr:hypothetical protein [Paenibacillus sp. P32E]OKP93953.1 hypothetical protein A3848_02655 [Paenibacillus sp. P32E]
MDSHTKPDKNLINTVDELNNAPVTSQEAQQMDQKKSDIRKEALRDDKTTYKKNEQNTYK